MIADGVFQGYAEVRIAMAKGRAPERPWHRAERPARSRDWVSEIAALAQRPGAQALAPVPQERPAIDRETFRRKVEQGRAEAIARSRIH